MRPEDEAEFAGLVDRQWRFAFKVAWAVLRQAQDAEDAAQEAFLKMLRTGGWRGLRNERAFVARTVWCVAIDRVRSQRLHTRGDPEVATEELMDSGPGPEGIVAAADWEALTVTD